MSPAELHQLGLTWAYPLDDEHRVQLQRPIVRDPGIYYTDGRVLLAIYSGLTAADLSAMSAEISESNIQPVGIVTQAILNCREYIPFNFLPVEIPPPVPVICPDCRGTGEVKCYACDHEHDCENCDGTGTVLSDNKANLIVFKFGQAIISNRTITLLSKLPGCKIGIPTDPLGLIHAAWDHGQACIMPCRNDPTSQDQREMIVREGVTP